MFHPPFINQILTKNNQKNVLQMSWCISSPKPAHHTVYTSISRWIRSHHLTTANITPYKPEDFKSEDFNRRSQWPRGLRRRSTAARLLGLWVRIPPGAWMSVVSVVCCCQVEVSATNWSLVQRSPTDCGASLCVIWKTSWMRNHTQSMWLSLI